MTAGYTETYADATKDRIERIAGKARDTVGRIAEIVTDSSEIANAVAEAQEAIWLVETTSAEVIDRRINPKA